VNELDTRGSHFYLTLYWAQALAKQTQDPELQARFAPVAEKLSIDTDIIVQELIDAQGQPVNIGGYYRPNIDLVASAMRPSNTLNAIINAI
jgi:isocitrate dehydrogenase